ncbi:MAG TPA: hypothetical protein VFV41_11850 [Streptosporangiaceae bacterium]|nr:hypothetical protein [Streptosporangiaceae bacterium]
MTRSPALADRQFQPIAGRPTNLDRCTRCGLPRAAHGIDWTCTKSATPDPTRLVAVIVAVGIAALAGVALLTLTSATATTAGSIGAAVCLAALVALICGVTATGRR